MTAITAQTTSDFKAFVLSSARGRMADMSDADFISFLNEALVNKYSELVRMVPSVYSKKTTLTVSNSYTATLPTDYKQTQLPQLFQDANSEHWIALYPSELFTCEGGENRFYSQTNDTFGLRYTARESQYSSGETVAETLDAQAKHMLLEEIKGLYFDAIEEGEPSGASQNARGKANDLS